MAAPQSAIFIVATLPARRRRCRRRRRRLADPTPLSADETKARRRHVPDGEWRIRSSRLIDAMYSRRR
jgi:hypothetical protein